jgi:hypothetical protein
MFDMKAPTGMPPIGDVGVNPETQIWLVDGTPVEFDWIDMAVVDRDGNAKSTDPELSVPA